MSSCQFPNSYSAYNSRAICKSWRNSLGVGQWCGWRSSKTFDHVWNLIIIYYLWYNVVSEGRIEPNLSVKRYARVTEVVNRVVTDRLLRFRNCMQLDHRLHEWAIFLRSFFIYYVSYLRPNTNFIETLVCCSKIDDQIRSVLYTKVSLCTEI